jgi:hypothetical protein
VPVVRTAGACEFIVAEDGRRFTFSLGFPAVKLIRVQAQEIEEDWGRRDV